MKVIRVFIFCLLLISIWLIPTVLFAAAKSVVLDLTISPPSDWPFEQSLWNQILEIIREGEFIEPINEPIVISKINIDGVEVISTISGSLETNIILSVF